MSVQEKTVFFQIITFKINCCFQQRDKIKHNKNQGIFYQNNLVSQNKCYFSFYSQSPLVKACWRFNYMRQFQLHLLLKHSFLFFPLAHYMARTLQYLIYKLHSIFPVYFNISFILSSFIQESSSVASFHLR